MTGHSAQSHNYEFSVADHTAHLRGYMDAVGRVLSPGWELVTLGAQLLGADEGVENHVGHIIGRDEIANWSVEFTQVVSSFLCLNDRERLGFYLIDYICYFRDFTTGTRCFKLDCEPKSSRILGQVVYLLEFEDPQRILLWFTRSVRMSRDEVAET